jgi:hypothetical protein
MRCLCCGASAKLHWPSSSQFSAAKKENTTTMREPVIPTPEEIDTFGGVGGTHNVVADPEPVPSDVLVQIARALEILGPKYNPTRASVADFDMAVYKQYDRGTTPPKEANYLCVRSISTRLAQGGIAIHPGGPVPHLETASKMARLDQGISRSV